MSTQVDTQSQYFLKRPEWLFVGGSLGAAVVAWIAEGSGFDVGFVLLSLCVAAICCWSLTGKPSLYWTTAVIAVALVAMGWTVEDPEPALFQSVLVTVAVGWRVDRLLVSVALLIVLTLVPFLGTLGPNHADWGWWNWSVGTALTWSLGRIIRLLDQTLTELTAARSQLFDSAAREERLRISRDVHDLVGHSLTAMLLNIRAAQRALHKDPTETEQALADAERVGTTGIADIRAALVDLRDDAAMISSGKESLSSLPDGEAVLKLLSQQSHISVASKGDVSNVQGPLAVALYRILQECITNCSKYAREGTASISLDVGPDEIVLFSENALSNSDAVTSSLSDKTLGLISMRERVTTLGGSFKAGVDGDRWQVQCRIPRYG